MTTKISLSPDQEAALDAIQKWKADPNSPQTLTLGGYAGTGKTTILSALHTSGIVYVSLTGKAVKVLRQKLPQGAFVSTIHALLYDPITDANGSVVGWEPKPIHSGIRLIVNDEASMTDEKLARELESRKCKILYVGDHAQLPPVKSQFNLMANPTLRLEQIHRQSKDSPILRLATEIRQGRFPKVGAYSEKCQVHTQANIPKFLFERMRDCANNTVIITGRNDTRVALNKRTLLSKGRTTSELNKPFPGARLICLRNNYKDGLFNGEVVTVEELVGTTATGYTLKLLTEDGRKVQLIANPDTFNCPKIPPDTSGKLFDFAYTLTCHKAQGSEYPVVIVVGQGFGTQDLRRRWLYTAVTRAQSELYVLL